MTEPLYQAAFERPAPEAIIIISASIVPRVTATKVGLTETAKLAFGAFTGQHPASCQGLAGTGLTPVNV